MQKNFVDSGFAAEIATLEKEYGRQIVGDDQLEMTPFQKQVLLLEEERQQEQAREQQGAGSQSPSAPLNARHSSNRGYTERIKYDNEQSFESDNQATFVE